MRRLHRLVPILILIALVGSSVLSLPRLSVEHGAPCQTCHINPAGGGMRNEFGNHAVAFHELTLPPLKKLVADRYRSPRLSDGVTVGFDLRYLVFEDGEVFRMQTDAYGAIEVFRDLFYHIRLSEHGTDENYGILYFDKQQHFIKAGQFTPSHGLKMEDHTAFVRARNGDDPHLRLDGLAAGVTLAGVNAAAEFFNPDDRGIYIFHAYRPGFIPQLNMSYLAGFSTRFTERVDRAQPPLPDNRAIFGGLSCDRFTLLGELDFAGQSPDTLLAYAALTTRIEYGLYLLAEYNFFDGDRGVADGAEENVRLSLDIYPLPFVELRPSYTRHTRGVLNGQEDFFLQFHIGY